VKLIAPFCLMNLSRLIPPWNPHVPDSRSPARHPMKPVFFSLWILLLTALNSPADGVPHPELENKHRAFLKDNCLNCHNAEKQKGKVRLDDISFSLDAVQKADLWQKILNAVNSGEMPPEDEKQPERGQKTEFLAALSETLVLARKSLSDVQGTITMRRLNRREYRNTIRDLLGLDINVQDLPSDAGAGNFDTVGSSLFMSSDQFEQYLALGRQALDEHFARMLPGSSLHPGHGHSKPAVTHRFDPETVANPHIEKQLKSHEGLHEKFARWQVEVDRAAAAPENQETLADLKQKDPRLNTPGSVVLYYHAEAFKGAPNPKDFGLGDSSNAAFGNQQYGNIAPFLRHYLDLPRRNTGAYLSILEGYARMDVPLPASLPPGTYRLKIRAGTIPGTPAERHFLEIGTPDEGRIRWNLKSIASTHQVKGTVDHPEILEVPFEVSSSTPPTLSIRERQPASHEAATAFYFEQKRKNGYGPDPAIWVDFVEVEGPAPSATPAPASTLRERREVELHANAMVGGTYNGYYKGGYEAAKAYIASGSPQKGIPDELEAKFRIKVFEEHGPSFERYLNDPLTKTGAYLTLYNVHTEEVITLPPDQPSGWLKTKHEVEHVPPGEYRLRVRIGAAQGTPKERHFLEFGSRVDKDDFKLLHTFQIQGTTEVPEVLEVPVSLEKNGPRTFVFREKRDVKLDREVYQAAVKETTVGPVPALWIDWVEWEGPTAPTQFRPALSPETVSLPDHERTRAVLGSFAQRAFRGQKPEPSFLDRLQALYDARRKTGEPWEVAIRTPLSVILASPGFLYLSEPGTEKNPRDLTQVELASRLSYFLWSAPPDDELLSANLSDPAVLVGQVDRLIASDKAGDFVRGFVHQWLGMERLDFFQFDTKQFRDFDESAKAAARREVYETFAHLLRENGSLTRLLKSDEIFVNGLLATYYGIEGVNGDAFQKVQLQPGSPRGGLLGMAAILAMGSNGERTSPVERGAWVLRKLLHNPPPPAPPNVPQITRLENQLLNTRQRLGAHQEEPQCLQCHRKIDPIGFGLENFNAAGKWRTEETYEKRGVGKKTWPVDASGQFHNGPAFKDYFELRDQIAARPEAFARGFSEALIEYALGRPYGFTDAALADGIVARAGAAHFGVREFLVALITSREFARK
jgi:hypothetical protein